MNSARVRQRRWALPGAARASMARAIAALREREREIDLSLSLSLSLYLSIYLSIYLPTYPARAGASNSAGGGIPKGGPTPRSLKGHFRSRLEATSFPFGPPFSDPPVGGGNFLRSIFGHLEVT